MMNKKLNGLLKSTLNISILLIATSTYAEMTLEEQVAKLQLEVQKLQALMQQQKELNTQNSESLQKLNENRVKSTTTTVKNDIKQLVTKGGADFELYGSIRADASYQFKGPSTMYNYISSVPLKGSAAERSNSDKFQSTLNATRFGFNFKLPKIGDHDIGGKLEMDFFGGSGRDTFRIRHAYFTYDNWLIGQTWSNFNAVEYYPETVDASLSIGGSLTRTSQIKYSYPLNKNMSLAFSLEDPKAETVTTTGTQDFKTDSSAKLKLPSAVGRINYKFNNGSVMSGRLFLTEKATTHDGNDQFLAWGAALGGKYQVTDTTLIRLDYNHIKGDTKNVLWSNYAYIFDTKGKIQTNEFDTVTVGLTQKITPKIRSTIGMGYMKANTGSRFAELVKNDPTQNKELIEGWINLFYNPVKPINLGVEYMYGERKTFLDQKGIDNRLNFTAIYEF